MATLKMNATELLAHSNETMESGQVALAMGAFSIALLFAFSAILSTLHYFFA